MILTELDEVILIAMAAGFVSGSLQTIIDYILQTKLEKRNVTFKEFINRFLFLSSAASVLFGIGTFSFAAWDTSVSASELNEFSFTLAAILSFLPVIEKFYYFVSQLKKS